MVRGLKSVRRNKKHDLEKTLYVLAFLITVLGITAIIGFSYFSYNNLGEAPLPAPFEGAICGNGIIEAGENCGNCFLDVRCLSDETCYQGFCVEKKRSLLPFTSVLIFISLTGIFFLGYKLMQRKKGKSKAYINRISS